MPWDVSPCQVSMPLRSGLLALPWAPGHADSRVGLALVSAAHHVDLQSWISITGLNWLVMHLCSAGHSLKNKGDIKGSIFLPRLLNAISSFNIQKSAQDPWQIGAIFFLFSLALSFLSLWISQIPCSLSPVLKFLTPRLPPVNTWTPLFTFNSPFFGSCSNFCSVLPFPSHFHPHSSLGNVDLFLTSSSRSKAPGDHQRSSAKKCVGICWKGRGTDF